MAYPDPVKVIPAPKRTPTTSVLMGKIVPVFEVDPAMEETLRRIDGKTSERALAQKEDGVKSTTVFAWIGGFGAILWVVGGCMYHYGLANRPPPLWIFDGIAGTAGPQIQIPVAQSFNGLLSPPVGVVSGPGIQPGRHCDKPRAAQDVPPNAFNVRWDEQRCQFHYSMH